MRTKYKNLSIEQAEEKLMMLMATYKEQQAKNLKLDMSRGKPCPEQCDLSMEMYDVLHTTEDFYSRDGFDCRNYGILDGIPEAKEIFAELLGVDSDEIFIGGNSSLNLMYDTMAKFMLKGGANSEMPWSKERKVKFLCPSPGYDRHFAICEAMGIEMVPIQLNEDGPKMDIVEALVSCDETIRGIWCVPQYSNPTGITYSDEVVRRMANLDPAAPDFVVMWDNAYLMHHFEDENSEHVLNIMEEAKKNGKEDMIFMFTSTSKISLPGSGLAVMAVSKHNAAYFKKEIATQTIGYDKINQLRHVKFFKNAEGIRNHMKKHSAIIEPKFKLTLEIMQDRLGDLEIGWWNEPKGGYFISFNSLPGCAKRIVQLCKDAGVTMTPAGVTYPYGRDPKDSNIRIAPSYPSLDELAVAIDIFTLCVKIASLESMLGR